MHQVPARYQGTIHDAPPQRAQITTPTAVPPPENGDSSSSSTEVIRALDEVLSELRALEIKYMLEPDSSGRPVKKVPLLIRLRFRCKGNRDLKAILRELRRHKKDLKAMTKDLRETIQCNLAISANRINSINVDLHQSAACQITPPHQAGEGFSMFETGDLIDLSPSISLGAGDAPAVDDPPPPLPDSTPSIASSRVSMSLSGVFESSGSFISYEREDNYSVFKHKGDKVCTQCHQVCRGARYS